MPRLGLGSNLTGSAAISAVNTDFVTEWTIAGGANEAGRTVTLPLYDSAPAVTYDFTINWGDGSSEDNVTAADDSERIHEFPEDAGTVIYTVTMSSVEHSGSDDRVGNFKFNNSGDKLKLTKITNWGSYIFVIDDAFWGCEELEITAEDAPDLSLCTAAAGLGHAFDNCLKITSIGDAAAWDVSGIKAFNYMFESCILFNQDIGMWNVTASTTFAAMFQNCWAFNQDISPWTLNTSAEISLSNLFTSATIFNHNLNDLDMSKCNDCWTMFQNAAAFTNGGVNPNWDLGYVGFFNGMFKNSAFNQSLVDTIDWGLADGSVYTTATFVEMFEDNEAFDQSLQYLKVTNINTGGTYQLKQMLNGSGVGISTANYNATLVEWADNQNATDSMTFDAGESTADGTTGGNDGLTARADLLSTDGWTIQDGQDLHTP